MDVVLLVDWLGGMCHLVLVALFRPHYNALGGEVEKSCLPESPEQASATSPFSFLTFVPNIW